MKARFALLISLCLLAGARAGTKPNVIHLRLLLPDGTTDLRRLEIKAVNGKPGRQWTFRLDADQPY